MTMRFKLGLVLGLMIPMGGVAGIAESASRILSSGNGNVSKPFSKQGQSSLNSKPSVKTAPRDDEPRSDRKEVKAKREGIHIGVHYEYPFGGMANRPEWLPRGEADWRRDLAMIKDTGFDSIRIRIGLDSNLDEVEKLLDICQELHLSVLFGNATMYVNDRFVKEFPDSRIIDRNGVSSPRNIHDWAWPRACLDYPEYRRQRNQLMKDYAKRFGRHPAVLDWDIHNEPFIGPGANPCYCKFTVAKYRQDLAVRFDSIAQVNKRFGTSFRSFDEVEPPKKIDANPLGFWRDWREFSTRNLSDFLLEGGRIIKEQAPGARVSFNLTDPYVMEWSGQDWWILPQLDYASASLMEGSGAKTAALTGAKLDLLKGLAPGKEVWVAESQGGPYNTDGGLLWRGKQIEAELNAAFSHGCKALYYYRWEPLMAGAEPWINGMVDADEYDTERRLATKRAIAELRTHEDLIATGHTVRPRIGIYLTRDQIWASSARQGRIDQTIYGLYGLFLDLGYEVAFLTGAFPSKTDTSVIAVPFALALSDAEQQAIKEPRGNKCFKLVLTRWATMVHHRMHDGSTNCGMDSGQVSRARDGVG